MNDYSVEKLEAETADALAGAASNLERVLVELAGRLRPFPAFMGMVSVQAVELEPSVTSARDLGCVVVDPAGQVCRLEITAIAGIAGLSESEQVEELQPLELHPAEYILYAATAIDLLVRELRRRGG